MRHWPRQYALNRELDYTESLAVFDDGDLDNDQTLTITSAIKVDNHNVRTAHLRIDIDNPSTHRDPQGRCRSCYDINNAAVHYNHHGDACCVVCDQVLWSDD